MAYDVLEKYTIIIFEEDDNSCKEWLKQLPKYYEAKVINRFGLKFVRIITGEEYLNGIRSGTIYKLKDKDVEFYEINWYYTSSVFKNKYKNYLRLNLINPKEFDNLPIICGGISK